MAARSVRRLVRSVGFDVVRYPNPTGSIGPHLLRLFQSVRIDCVLDVGAHWGEYASLVRDAGYDGEIVSFEPEPASVVKLMERSALDPRWSIQSVALGSQDGQAEIRVYRHSDLTSFRTTTAYGRSEFPEATSLERVEMVDVRRLDGMLHECVERAAERRFFLKIDTQGWDLEVLSGAQGCLDRIFGLQSELSVKPLYEGMPSYLDALAELDNHGFELTGIFPVQRDAEMRILELDCVMRKTGSSNAGSSA